MYTCIAYQRHWTLRRPRALANDNRPQCCRYRDYCGDGDHGWWFRAVLPSTLDCFSYDITLVELGMFAVLSVMGYIVLAQSAWELWHLMNPMAAAMLRSLWPVSAALVRVLVLLKLYSDWSSLLNL